MWIKLDEYVQFYMFMNNWTCSRTLTWTRTSMYTVQEHVIEHVHMYTSEWLCVHEFVKELVQCTCMYAYVHGQEHEHEKKNVQEHRHEYGRKHVHCTVHEHENKYKHFHSWTYC